MEWQRRKGDRLEDDFDREIEREKERWRDLEEQYRKGCALWLNIKGLVPDE
jgi:hypothetical protein